MAVLIISKLFLSSCTLLTSISLTLKFPYILCECKYNVTYFLYRLLYHSENVLSCYLVLYHAVSCSLSLSCVLSYYFLQSYHLPFTYFTLHLFCDDNLFMMHYYHTHYISFLTVNYVIQLISNDVLNSFLKWTFSVLHTYA